MNKELTMKIVITTILLFILTACSTYGEQKSNAAISSEVLLESTTSWDGQDFVYPDGDAQLNITKINMPKGSSLPVHCHPVPLAGVLTKGVLEVVKENGEVHILNKDEALIEVSMQWHHGNAMEDVEILVVYSGAEGLPVTVFKDGDPQLVSQCL
jgi:quercetin dioxygenase-like cupin family protein